MNREEYISILEIEKSELKKENQQLKEELNYLRSGEYYNQLRFERDMLQDLVDDSEVSKEDKEFIDMTHRNIELLEQLKQRDEVIDEVTKFIINKRYQPSPLGFELELNPSELWQLLIILKNIKE